MQIVPAGICKLKNKINNRQVENPHVSHPHSSMKHNNVSRPDRSLAVGHHKVDMTPPRQQSVVGKKKGLKKNSSYYILVDILQ